jgi:CelD/BcsL family acetyltransferase involved in cellulose biosynthesis
MAIDLVTDEDALLRLENDWESLLADSAHPSIFMSFDYQYAGWKTFHRPHSEPFVVSVRDARGGLIGLVPFRSSRDRGSWVRWRSLTYLASFEIDRPAPLIRLGSEAEFWAALQRFLADAGGGWDVLRMPELPADQVAAALAAFSSPRQRFTASPGPSAIGVDLRPSWDEFIGQHRNLRKHVRGVERKVPGLDVWLYDDPSRILEGFALFTEVESRSWKAGKVGVSKDARHTEFYRDLLQRLVRRKRVAVRILAAGDQPVAGDITYTLGRRVFFHHGTYDQAYADWSPGTFLTCRLFQDYMDCGYDSGDFLCGFADYMRPWCTIEWHTTNVMITRESGLMRLSRLAQRLKAPRS